MEKRKVKGLNGDGISMTSFNHKNTQIHIGSGDEG